MREDLPKFPNRPVIQVNAKLATEVLTPTYAKRKIPVTMAEAPIIQRRPKRVLTSTAALNGPTTPTADSIQ